MSNLRLFDFSDGRATEGDVRKRKGPLLLSFGGGVDSTAMAIEMVKRRIFPDAVVFADTGGEKPRTYEFIEAFDGWLQEHAGVGITVIRRKPVNGTDATLEQEMLRKTELPSRVFGLGRCARDWKVRPISTFVKRWPLAIEARARGEKTIKAIGYDGGEEARARKALQKDDLEWRWYPLIEWAISRAECLRIIRAEFLPIPPKSACFFCPSSKKGEVLALATEYPDLMARAIEMERRALESESREIQVAGLGRAWSWSALLAADAELREKMAEAPVESCIACEDDACPTDEAED